MATSKAPKHDFAPAWLKIPNQDSQKWPGGKQGDGSRAVRKDDHYGSYHPYPPDYAYHPLTRQRSFDNYYDDRRYPAQKFRHNSADDDYYSTAYSGYGYYNGYSYDKHNPHYRSQPTLYRRGDSKYTHPNARFTQMNGVYPGYYDPYPYEYYHGDPYYNNGYNGGRSIPSGKSHGDNRSSRHDHRDKRGEDKSNSKDSIDDDFPSLKGDAADSSTNQQSKSSSSTGVWDNSLSAKVRSGGQQLHSEMVPLSPESSNKNSNSSSKQNNNSIYKALVPNKQAGLIGRPSKDALKLNASSNKDVNSNNASKSVVSKTGKDAKISNLNGAISPTLQKEGSLRHSPTPAREILNTRLVTQPRNLPDKKSQFLKTLRRENSNNEMGLNGDCQEGSQEGEDSTEGVVVNGVERLSVSSETAQLSSSLEAEQRLLKEMGWNEADDDEDYEITEDEMKEFQNLSKQIKEQHGKNGLQRSLPKAWSPQHLPVYNAHTADLSDSMSTTSEDTDTDDD